MNTIGIIGLGTLGQALARGFHRAVPTMDILATTREKPVSLPFVTPCASNEDLAARANTILLCVKPEKAAAVLTALAPALTPQHRIVSACAGLSLEALGRMLAPGQAIARAMPNITCEFNEGMTGIAFGSSWPHEEQQALLQLFTRVGQVVPVEERHFDAVTALSGCGPAYVCVIAEAFSDAGVKAGLPRDVSRLMAVQTLLGSTLLLRNVDEHPAAIRDRVTTPGGCTIDALTRLEEGGVRATLIAAVMTAAEKSAALSAK